MKLKDENFSYKQMDTILRSNNSATFQLCVKFFNPELVRSLFSQANPEQLSEFIKTIEGDDVKFIGFLVNMRSTGLLKVINMVNSKARM